MRDMLPKWQTGVVTDIVQATPNTRRFWITLPEQPTFAFLPGQFVTLDLPISDQRNKRWRSYSIASAPHGGNVIELIIVQVIGGLASPYIFNNIKIGDSVTLRGPHGIFVLPTDLDKEHFFICTGTGIAPFRSMLRHIKAHSIPFHKIHLLFGTRRREDLLYEAEMRALEAELPGFHYHPTLSRQHWEGRTGYVHDIYRELCQDHPEAKFMLCGWTAMVDDAQEKILEMGYAKKDIQVERYG